MKNSNRGKRVPYVKPVQRVEISESNVKIRMILIVVLLAVAAVAIITGVSSALRTEPGWHRIEVQSTKMNCGADFVLDYDFSDAGKTATAGFKKLTALYSAACEDAFRIFSPDVPGGALANVHDLNARPNEPVLVEPALYRALEQVQRSGNRNIYLGAVYAEYDRIFRSESEPEAASNDPAQNPELIDYIAQAAAFANDPSMIDLQLLGNNQVKLVVSDAYLEFIRTYEVEKLVDFGWMKNAFIADYLAQVLTDNGFTNGYLASFDGFNRNLDTRGNSYSFNVFNRRGTDIYQSAVMTYQGPAALVFLRDYPLADTDRWTYYAFPNGRIATMLIDPKDGMDKASVDSLISYCADGGCAELLLQIIPVYIADAFSAQQLQTMASKGIHSIWCEEGKIFYTDENLDLNVLPQDNVSYTKVFAGK